MKIKVDGTRCEHPDRCMRCVMVCPAKVIVLKPIVGKKSTAAVGEICSLFTDLCNGCLKCEEVCPENCIRIVF